MGRIDRRAIKATDILPWPSTWVLWCPRAKQYLKNATGGVGIKMEWCKDIKDALHLPGNDAMFLAPLIGEIDSPIHIIQCPEEN
jgi:hypothetical protein